MAEEDRIIEAAILANTQTIFVESCTKCDPVIVFDDADSHRKHMQLIHGCSVFFRD